MYIDFLYQHLRRILIVRHRTLARLTYVISASVMLFAPGLARGQEACCTPFGCLELEPSLCDDLDGTPQGGGT